MSSVKKRKSGFIFMIISISTASSAPKLDALPTLGCKFSDAHVIASSAVHISAFSFSTISGVNLFNNTPYYIVLIYLVILGSSADAQHSIWCDIKHVVKPTLHGTRDDMALLSKYRL